MSRVRGALCAGILVLIAGLSCKDSNGPVAGPLTLSLQSPNSGQDGAIVFVVTGPVAPTGASAPVGLRVFRDTLGTSTKFVVTGTLSTGTVLTLDVTDVNQVAQYGAIVQQVATTSYQLRALSAYAVLVAK